jgi:signal transduction histidine kinase
MMIPSLFGRLALLVVALFLVASALLLKLADSNNENYSNLVQQSLHHDLAARMIEDNSLLKAGQIDQAALANTFHALMLLGPAYEIYTLDTNGKILVYSADPGLVRSKTVDLAPVQRFLEGATLPAFGDDPRNPSAHNIFSVARIHDPDGSIAGYLYVILRSQQQAAVEQSFAWQGLENQARNFALVALSFTAFVLLILFAKLARPLSSLNQSMARLRRDGFKHSEALTLQPLPAWASVEVVQLHQSFAELMQFLAAQFKQIKDEERLRRELLSHITHDLKTPLAALQGYLETWLLQHAKGTGYEYLEIALRNAEQLNTLVDQLVELARLEGGVETVRLEPIAIAELAQDVLSKFTLRAQQLGVTLQVTPRDTSLMIRADIGKLERVLTNLIDNALRHTPAGGTISIELSRSPGSDILLITVRDTGLGIAHEDLDRIFEPNFRGSHGFADNAAHLGLGLAIVRRLLELHESSIRVMSEPGNGSAFNFGLPLVKG